MISVQQLRKNLYQLFGIMSKTTLTVEVVYDGVVYELYLVPTDKKPNLRRRRTKGVEAQYVPAENCERCNSIKFAGVCMNKSCESNL